MQAAAATGVPPLLDPVSGLQPASLVWATPPRSGTDGTWAMHVRSAEFLPRHLHTPAAGAHDAALPLPAAALTHVNLIDTTLWCGPSLGAAEAVMAETRRGAVHARPLQGLWPEGSESTSGAGSGDRNVAARGEDVRSLLPVSASPDEGVPAEGPGDGRRYPPGGSPDRAAAASGMDAASVWPAVAAVMGIVLGAAQPAPRPGACMRHMHAVHACCSAVKAIAAAMRLLRAGIMAGQQRSCRTCQDVA